ncbi:hypothetical protein [Lacticaseibacillus sp. 53-4]|uniref:hypothetical protein n=1 Tax=Lacticaseibacillus sp. 53-4 TaxID=2799575 RepID=UPI0019439181|nr:hypothetical protein [Lacticaseibacillus sp. 53-4]
MSNETKRDVFEDMKWELIRNLANTIDQNGGLRPLEDATKVGENYATRYADALSDDLPVIPKAVGEYIKRWKADLLTEPLFVIFLTIQHNMNIDNPPDFEAENWIVDHGDTFSRAWLDGVWRVEETGEIVKLEAEK